ncbi:MAG TPA: T9SS type A sorting domain-containing protein, partial [Chryseosolibacter sp.]|nr:T9SS type A sorting domain-containing protein [Chryseosolibacter sp.]
MVRIACFLMLLAPLTSKAQFTYFLDQSVPVYQHNGDQLSLAWAGGLNAAQVNMMDLNADGVEDLVVFDRMANKVITFITADNEYAAAPEYEDLFPKLSNWLLLRDYNCDGKKDVFTGDVLGIKVYKNISIDGENLEWEPRLFDTGFTGPKSTVLLTQGFESKVNLQLQYDDLPSISDVDGDGDIDILNVQYAGYTVEFHQNLSVENNLPCDSLDFKRITRNWGNFRDCECGEFAFHGESCPPSSGGRTQHSGGKSLLALDLNGDRETDLLFSEAECTQLYAFTNEGTMADPLINSASAFPQSNPLNFAIFPAAFYEDVDFDGKKDLIATPNIFTREYLNSDLSRSTWLYKNSGTNASPQFTFVEKDFLQKKMIDIGDNAVPAFLDVDADGDLDLFISANSSNMYASTVSLYENTGSSSSPAFSLLNDDFLGFSSSRFYNVKIQFADIDADQTIDFVFTATHFDNNLTNLYYLANKSSAGLDVNGGSLRAIDFSLNRTENVYIADVDQDGLSDILAGRSEGSLEYWKNAGIQSAPIFVLEEENYLGFGPSSLRQNITCAAADLDADGKVDLILGDQTGKLSVISDFRSSSSAEAEQNLIFNPALGMYVSKNLGGRVWPAVANLYNANKPAIAVGNILGGIHLLRHNEGKSLPDEPQVNVYPNPIAKNELLNVQADRQVVMQVLSVLGQQLGPLVVIRANQVQQYTLPPLASGLYLLKFT